MKNQIDAKSRSLQINKEYKQFLQDIKQRIKSTRLRAALAVNQEVIKFYWEIGQLIIEKQKISQYTYSASGVQLATFIDKVASCTPDPNGTTGRFPPTSYLLSAQT